MHITRCGEVTPYPVQEPRTTNMKTSKKMKKELVLWGSHPSYCNGAWLKLSANLSNKNQERRRAEGWTLEIKAIGNKPEPLPQKPHKIIVTVEGGVVQNVSFIPPGFEVEIRDFDTDGADTDELPKDDGGNAYAPTVFVSE